MDSVGDSGEVKFHGLDDGTRVKTDWMWLRYLPPSLLHHPPLNLTVRLNSAPPVDAEAVKIFQIGVKRGQIGIEGNSH